MIDREKVMTWLEICGKNRDCSGKCPYGDGTGHCEGRLCREDLMADALVLLQDQDQEAVEPKEIIFEHFPVGDYRRTIGWLCGKCGKALMGGGNYCSYCGQAVKWT